jgi:hypothetical protein
LSSFSEFDPPRPTTLPGRHCPEERPPRPHSKGLEEVKGNREDKCVPWKGKTARTRMCVCVGWGEGGGAYTLQTRWPSLPRVKHRGYTQLRHL